jgi:hypothetical protein
MNAEGAVSRLWPGRWRGMRLRSGRICRTGYTPLSARDLMRAMARASCWLEDRRLAVGGLTSLLAADLQADVRHGVRCCGSCGRPAWFPPWAARLVPDRRRRCWHTAHRVIFHLFEEPVPALADLFPKQTR